jgi:hypothetical protein
VILNAIRKDRVRPPFQARNLFHFSAAMYDVWTQYNSENTPYLFRNDTPKACKFSKKISAKNTNLALERAMSYAAYQIIKARYKESP